MVLVGGHLDYDQILTKEIVVELFAVGLIVVGELDRIVTKYTAADFVETAVDLPCQMATQKTVLAGSHLSLLEVVVYIHVLLEIAAGILEGRKEETAAAQLVVPLDFGIFVVGQMDSLGN